MRDTIVVASEALASGRLTRRELDRAYTKPFATCTPEAA